jgi:hypothetical protein
MSRFLLTLRSLELKLYSLSNERRILMPDVTIPISDQEQQKIEGIVIDKDGDEALKYLAELVHRFKLREGHACGPKAAEGTPGHG